MSHGFGFRRGAAALLAILTAGLTACGAQAGQSYILSDYGSVSTVSESLSGSPPDPASYPPPPHSSPLPAEPVPLAPLRVQGRGIVDNEGNEFYIRGISITERWYTLFKKEEDITAFYRACLRYGLNTVRICVSADELEGLRQDSGSGNAATGLDRLEQTVAMAARAGMYSIIHLRVPPGGLYGNENKNEEPLFESEAQQQRFAALWKSIALRFTGNDAVLGYSLLHEPSIPVLGDEAEALAHYGAVLQKAADAIRASDKSGILILERPSGFYGQTPAREDGADSGNAVTEDSAGGTGLTLSPDFPRINDPSGNILLDAHLFPNRGRPFEDRIFAFGATAQSVLSSRYTWYDDWLGYGYSSLNHGKWHTVSANISLKSGDGGIISAFLNLKDIDPDTVVYIDNLTLVKITQDGREVVLDTDFNDTALINAYNLNPGWLAENPWKKSDKLLRASRYAGDTLLYSVIPSFAINPGETWTVSAEIRLEGPKQPLETARFTIGAYEYAASGSEGVDYLYNDLFTLWTRLQNTLAAAKAYGKPLYAGELGIRYTNLGQYGNMAQWSEAVSDFTRENLSGFAWYSAAAAGTGLWTDAQTMEPELRVLFEEYFAREGWNN